MSSSPPACVPVISGSSATRPNPPLTPWPSGGPRHCPGLNDCRGPRKYEFSSFAEVGAADSREGHLGLISGPYRRVGGGPRRVSTRRAGRSRAGRPYSRSRRSTYGSSSALVDRRRPPDLARNGITWSTTVPAGAARQMPEALREMADGRSLRPSRGRIARPGRTRSRTSLGQVTKRMPPTSRLALAEDRSPSTALGRRLRRSPASCPAPRYRWEHSVWRCKSGRRSSPVGAEPARPALRQWFRLWTRAARGKRMRALLPAGRQSRSERSASYPTLGHTSRPTARHPVAFRTSSCKSGWANLGRPGRPRGQDLADAAQPD